MWEVWYDNGIESGPHLVMGSWEWCVKYALWANQNNNRKLYSVRKFRG